MAHLQRHVSKGHTPLTWVHHNNNWPNIHSANITKLLRSAVNILGRQVGFKPKKVSARSMRVGGVNGATPRKSRHRHHMYSGAVEGQRNSPINPHVCTDLHRRPCSAHGTAWGPCAHPSLPQVLTLSLPKAGPLIGLSWEQVGGFHMISVASEYKYYIYTKHMYYPSQ